MAPYLGASRLREAQKEQVESCSDGSPSVAGRPGLVMSIQVDLRPRADEKKSLGGLAEDGILGGGSGHGQGGYGPGGMSQGPPPTNDGARQSEGTGCAVIQRPGFLARLE